VQRTHEGKRDLLLTLCTFPFRLNSAFGIEFPSTTSTMPRAKAFREQRMTYILAEGQFHLRDPDSTYEDDRTICPYCQRQMKSSANRSRHIMLRPECRERHMAKLKAMRARECERAYKTAGPSKPRSPQGTSGAGPSTEPQDNSGPRYNDPRRWGDDGRTCREPYVEHFPFRGAGEPISRSRHYPQNLGAYIASCGNMANRDWFETAEVLMTTGLSGKARTRHLKTPVVSIYGTLHRQSGLPDSTVQARRGAVDRRSHAANRRRQTPTRAYVECRGVSCGARVRQANTHCIQTVDNRPDP
jgi:hypothetical protein